MSSSTSITPRETPHTKEWQLRIELAAAFQLAHRFGWTELVWNHISARVPGEPDHFLINPIGLRWDEITASKLIKIDNKGELLTGDGIAPKAGFVIHSAIHEARPDVNACMHTHTNDQHQATADACCRRTQSRPGRDNVYYTPINDCCSTRDSEHTWRHLT